MGKNDIIKIVALISILSAIVLGEIYDFWNLFILACAIVATYLAGYNDGFLIGYMQMFNEPQDYFNQKEGKFKRKMKGMHNNSKEKKNKKM